MSKQTTKGNENVEIENAPVFELEQAEEPVKGFSEELNARAQVLYDSLTGYIKENVTVKDGELFPDNYRIKDNAQVREIVDNQGYRAFFRKKGFHFSTRTKGTIRFRFKDTTLDFLRK